MYFCETLGVAPSNPLPSVEKKTVNLSTGCRSIIAPFPFLKLARCSAAAGEIAIVGTPRRHFPFRLRAMSWRIPRCLQRASLLHSPPSPASLKRAFSLRSVLPEDLYDVVIVGGGIIGLAMATSLGISPVLHATH